MYVLIAVTYSGVQDPWHNVQHQPINDKLVEQYSVL